MNKFYTYIIFFVSLMVHSIRVMGADVLESGKCGDNVTYTLYSDGLLNISGSGDMYNYSHAYPSPQPAPWYEKSITRVTIENGVTCIGDYAFRDCKNLIAITIPESATNVGKSAFSGCSSLTSITLPDNVSVIGVFAFASCSALTTIRLPKNLKTIWTAAFSRCTSLESIVIPEGVEKLKPQLFEYCSSLKSVHIPNSVKEVGHSFFYDCSSLTDVYISEGVEGLEEPMFEMCSSLKTIEVAPFNKKYCSKDGVLYNKDMTSIIACPAKKEGAFVIPSSVDSIRWSCFYGCDRLTYVEIPNGLTDIGANAFAYCRFIKSIVIPASVKSIANAAFESCSALQNVTNLSRTPQTTSRMYMFNSYGTLHVISGCKEAYLNSGKWNKFTIKDDIVDLDLPQEVGTTFEINAIHYEITSVQDKTCKVVSNGGYYSGDVIIPAYVQDYKVTGIGQSAFEGCTDLSSIVIPNSVVNIENRVFFGCTKLVSITIPKNVNAIGQEAFIGCANLREFICKAFDLPISSDYIFSEDVCRFGTLYVPQKSLEKYSSTSPWKKWGTIVGTSNLASDMIVDRTSVKLHRDETTIISVKIYPYDVDDNSVVWRSSDASIASVENGVVTAHNVGKVAITVTTVDGSNISASCEVVVEPILTTSISLSETLRPLNVGEHFTLSTTILPNNTTSKVVSWSSTDNNVASVSNGVVTAIASGNATITAKATDGSGCSATCNITVNKYQQSIAWEQDLTALRVDGEMVELDATSSSGLPVTYKIADESIASYFDMGSKKYINPNKEGATMITARQEGNDKYSSVEMTKTVIVQASAGIENIENPDALLHVYNLHGMKLRVFSRNDFNKDVSSGMIKAGVYIVNGKKIIIR